ncbi:hypothetical protein L2E82_18696 [Cichorium intybus]|uniref:Uncharacterized protein n=1 Tax=Cichorium intybus TaxID=13427 RepID=A0ACB9FB89_CICIN|nr:hypothetical protein L2E82_18696 [Cichorium intybus]
MMVEGTPDGCVEKDEGMVEEPDDDTHTVAGYHGAKRESGVPLCASVFSDQPSQSPMGLQTTANGSKEGSSLHGHGISAAKVAKVAWSLPEQQSQSWKKYPVAFLPVQHDNDTYTGDRGCPVEQQSQTRKLAPVVFLPVQQEDDAYIGDRSLAGDKSNTGAGSHTGDCMRDDDSQKMGDIPVGGMGQSFFCSQSHAQKENKKVLNVNSKPSSPINYLNVSPRFETMHNTPLNPLKTQNCTLNTHNVNFFLTKTPMILLN